MWLPDGKNEDVFIRFDRIHERDRQTDILTAHDGVCHAYTEHRAAKYVRRKCYTYDCNTRSYVTNELRVPYENQPTTRNLHENGSNLAAGCRIYPPPWRKPI